MGGSCPAGSPQVEALEVARGDRKRAVLGQAIDETEAVLLLRRADRGVRQRKTETETRRFTRAGETHRAHKVSGSDAGLLVLARVGADKRCGKVVRANLEASLCAELGDGDAE